MTARCATSSAHRLAQNSPPSQRLTAFRDRVVRFWVEPGETVELRTEREAVWASKSWGRGVG
eukprot:3332683-Rhodomonas_salina.7